MIVCICRRVSDRDIERKVRDGCCSFEELQDELDVATGCGACTEYARSTFDCHRIEIQSAGCERRIPVAHAQRVPAHS